MGTNSTTDSEGVSGLISAINAVFKNCVIINSGFNQITGQELSFENCYINVMYAEPKGIKFEKCDITDAYGPSSGSGYSCLLYNCNIYDSLVLPLSGAQCLPLFVVATINAYNSNIELNNADSIVYPNNLKLTANACSVKLVSKNNLDYSNPFDNLILNTCSLITSFPKSAMYINKISNCNIKDLSGNDISLSWGEFSNKPSSPVVGYKYFCTDKQITEGAANGIEIIHKGNNVWVDALGRVVS